jgi:hypothetical protein
MPQGSGARLSVNEVETLCLKAARGAGMDWGQAEEAGFAAGWLAARGLDGAAVLLARLDGAEFLHPISTAGQWRAPDGQALCPIELGAALGDFAALPEAAMSDAPLRVGPVATPLLLLPFLEGVAKTQETVLRLVWAGGCVGIDQHGVATGDIAALARSGPVLVDLSPCPEPTTPRPALPGPPAVGAQTLRRLGQLAARTMVAPSASSRADAGAATGDND